MPTSIRQAVEALIPSEQLDGFRANDHRGSAIMEFPIFNTHTVITTDSSEFQSPTGCPAGPSPPRTARCGSRTSSASRTPRKMRSSVNGHQELPTGGHETCPVMVTRTAR